MKGNQPGDKNYVDPDKPQPCQNKGLRGSMWANKKYRENFDRIFGKK